MKHLTDEEYNRRMRKLKTENIQRKKLENLKSEENKYKVKRKLPSTSKLLLIGAILLCLQIVLFCEYVMVKLQDTSSMYVLIGIPASLIPIILGYFYKSKAENTSGGIVFETAMSQLDCLGNASDEPDREESDVEESVG